MGHRHRHRERKLECSTWTNVVGQGQRRLFIMVMVLKNGGRWEFLGQMAKIKGQAFKKMIVKFMQDTSPTLTTILVVDRRKESREDCS